MPKKKTHLPVWAFFRLRKYSQESDENVICHLCKAVILARDGNTTNLYSHLKYHHAKEHASTALHVFQSMMERDHGICYPFYGQRKDSTFYNVEKPGFRKMVKNLDPRYELPSRKVTKQLQEAEYYSLTMDLWSSSDKRERYLAVTCIAHYINKVWEMKSHCLNTLILSQDCTEVNISDALQSIMESWSLPENKLAQSCN